MGRRANIKERKGPPPKGLSRYAQKRQRQLMRSSEREVPDQLLAQQVATSEPTPSRVLPKGTELAFGQVSGNFLKKGGYVFLIDSYKRRIYLSDGVLEEFDENFKIVNGCIIECAVAVEERGRRAVKVFDIQPPK